MDDGAGQGQLLCCEVNGESHQQCSSAITQQRHNEYKKKVTKDHMRHELSIEDRWRESASSAHRASMS